MTGSSQSINILLHLIQSLQDIRNSLQYNFYITQPDLRSKILNMKVEENNNISATDTPDEN